MSVVNDDIYGRPVAECTAAQVAYALTRSFEGYLPGRVDISAGAYESRFRAEDLDPFASRVYLRSGELAGVLLVTRRGWTSRMAGMGVVPAMRGNGLGRWILQGAIRDAKERGDKSIVLETFEQNTGAVRLYAGLGFSVRRRLYGYSRKARTPPQISDTLSEIDPLDFARVVAKEGEPDLPWMLSAETFSSATTPARAYHLGHHAYALIGDPEAETITLRAMVVPRKGRRQGWGTRLLRALYAAFPVHDWAIPAIVPESLAHEFLTKLGWKRENLNQLEMSLDLSPGS